MMRALLRVRFRALFAAFMRQSQQKKKKSAGMTVLFLFLYLYLAVVICGMMGLLFFTLAEPYHVLGLDWLYFSMAGLMSLGFAVIGSVFTTQSQLYDAKDNDLLLSMPIPPRMILLSRMIPLLAMNLLFAGIVFLPAMVVYSAVIGFSFGKLILQLLSLLAVTLLAQAIACLLGWLLHLLLGKVNKSVASMVYMVAFLGIYFYVYSQAGDILNSLALSGEAIAGAFRSWVWPLYALGTACLGDLLLGLVFAVICCAVFALVYWLLSVTFLRSAVTRRSGKRRGLDLARVKASSPSRAILRAELKRFLGTPVYLTNMGLGLILVPGLAIAGVIFRSSLLDQFGPALPLLEPYIPLILCATLAFMASMTCISTPSVSLEGKNLWILKSLPVSSQQILRAKLDFHCLMAAPVTAVSGTILAAAFGCSIADSLLCGILPALLCILCGLLGLVCGLKWARFDWLSEAYPCKQSVAVLVVMFSMMGVPLVFGLAYALVQPVLSPTLFLALASAILAAASFGLYRLLMGWGARKWESL